MIRQPNAILGNSQILASIGARGELLAFFYPRIDYAQNVEESLAGIYSEGRMFWVNEEWESRQAYLESANILQTALHHATGIDIEIEDMVLPGRAMLVRRFKIAAPRKFKGKFFYYAGFAAGERRGKNSAFADPSSGIIVQYWQDINIGLGSVPEFEEWQIGKAFDTAWWANARLDSEDGVLRRNSEEIGYVNASTSWPLELEANSEKEIVLFLAASGNRFSLRDEIRRIRKLPYTELQNQTRDFWHQWISRARELKLEEYRSAFERSLLALMLLRDKQFGSFIAAPEFDHFFEKSGGYGYCWNRDAVHMASALDMAGYVEAGDAFAAWCRKVQLEDGSWFQRYWVNGDLAPSWGNFDFSTQLDQVGCTLHFYWEHSRYLSSKEYFGAIWESTKKGASYIMKRTLNGLHDACIDLWETHYGSFAYTSAALYRGLLSSAQVASAIGESDLAEEWRSRAMQIKQEVIGKLWLEEGCFARGMLEGELDETCDASFLGLVEPFELLDLRDSEERSMIERSITLMEKKLGIYVNQGTGIKRFEGDDYIGGNPWTITTLWYATVLLRLANYYQKSDQIRAKSYREKAIECIDWCLRGSTSTGLMPEQVDRLSGKPAWAIPCGWAHALMIKCLLTAAACDSF